MLRRAFFASMHRVPLHRAVYQWCQGYVDRYQNTNNDNPESNGEYAWLRTILPNCRIVFDVGAHHGNWAAYALSINPALELHCFEPSPTTFTTLQQRVFPPTVHRVNIGLSDQQGIAELHVFPDEPMMNSVYGRTGIAIASTSTETITLDALDRYCASAGIERIDLLKMDVEGHELSVLQGSTEMLARGAIRAIQFEYGGCNIDARVLLKDLFAVLEAHGYRVSKLFPDGAHLLPGYEQRLETFQYQNFVATR